MLFTIGAFFLVGLLLGFEAYKEHNKTQRIKSLSSIQGITPEDIIHIINETKETGLWD